MKSALQIKYQNKRKALKKIAKVIFDKLLGASTDTNQLQSKVLQTISKT